MTSALEPTTPILSPVTATASAHGRRASPVQTRALTIASEVVGPTVEFVVTVTRQLVRSDVQARRIQAREAIDGRMEEVG
jgi:hypothetical protein